MTEVQILKILEGKREINHIVTRRQCNEIFFLIKEVIYGSCIQLRKFPKEKWGNTKYVHCDGFTFIYLLFFRDGWVGKHTQTRVRVFKSEDNLWVSGVKLGLSGWIVDTFTCEAIFLIWIIYKNPYQDMIVRFWTTWIKRKYIKYQVPKWHYIWIRNIKAKRQ